MFHEGNGFSENLAKKVGQILLNYFTDNNRLHEIFGLVQAGRKYYPQVFSAVLLLALFAPQCVQARTLVLVHGFLGNDMNWRTSGFTRPLLFAGWKDGGSYGYTPQNMLLPRYPRLAGDAFFTVNLPSSANLQTQEQLLSRYLQHLFAQRGEPITLVGHSAGGVVARLYTLDPKHVPVNGLITIAAPHLGTPTANIAYLAGNSPLAVMADFAGADELRAARGLFTDLKEETPNTFLYWMNHQPHPDIHYASIIRSNEQINKVNKFDFIVPPFSQDMNNVWALRGKSGTAVVTEGHSLNGKDGAIVLEVLSVMQRLQAPTPAPLQPKATQKKHSLSRE